MRTLALGIFLAIALSTSPAFAGRCHRGGPAPRSPIALSLDPADFGAALGPCINAGFSLGGHLAMLIDTPDFYGNIRAGGDVRMAITPTTNLRVGVTWTPIQFRYVVNASITRSALTMGMMTLYAQYAIVRSGPLQIAPHVRFALPTQTQEQIGTPFGIEGGVSVEVLLHQRIAMFTGITFPVMLGLSGSRVHAAFEPRLYVDMAFFLSNWFEPILGFEAQLSSGPDGAFRYLAPRAALRALFSGTMFLEFAAMFPLLGFERTLTRATLTFGSAW